VRWLALRGGTSSVKGGHHGELRAGWARHERPSLRGESVVRPQWNAPSRGSTCAWRPLSALQTSKHIQTRACVRACARVRVHGIANAHVLTRYRTCARHLARIWIVGYTHVSPRHGHTQFIPCRLQSPPRKVVCDCVQEVARRAVGVVVVGSC